MLAFTKDNILVLVARDRRGRPSTPCCLKVDGASVAAALAGVVTPGSHLIGDGGKAIAALESSSTRAAARRRLAEANPPITARWCLTDPLALRHARIEAS
jgi:hypothetical protein